MFSRKEIKSIKLFVRLKNLDLTTTYFDISIYSWPPIGEKINQLESGIMLNKRYIKSIKREIFCFDFLSSIFVSISFLLFIGKER